ncbi:MAG: dihydropteroate synthase [Bacteroidales bacterium]|nr:dihydropteroate synthase [Bacteroidales bacterium]
MKLKIGEHFFSWDRPLVMGILNLTPDSFYDGGSHNNTDDVLRHCEKMLTEGTDIIDIGAFSSRPGMEIISAEEENRRLLPYLTEIKKRFPETIISIDTFRKEVAKNALENGADIINDISGGIFDEEMLPYIGENHIPYIMMHCGGSIESLHTNHIKENPCEIVKSFFERQIEFLSQYGEQQVILDPGIGFNKSMKSNFELLNNINEYRVNNLPVLIGISRKSMIYKTLKITSQEALNGTTVLNTIALIKGADILRVHDVKEAVEAVKLVNELRAKN